MTFPERKGRLRCGPCSTRMGTRWDFVETPEGLRIYEIGEDYIPGHSMDELGVETIQVWPRERRGPENASRPGKSY